MKQLTVHKEDLPMVITYVSPEGEQVSYHMLPAGRKPGLLLNKVMAAISRFKRPARSR